MLSLEYTQSWLPPVSSRAAGDGHKLEIISGIFQGVDVSRGGDLGGGGLSMGTIYKRPMFRGWKPRPGKRAQTTISERVSSVGRNGFFDALAMVRNTARVFDGEAEVGKERRPKNDLGENGSWHIDYKEMVQITSAS